MGHGSSTHKKESPDHHDEARQTVHKRLDMLKKFDSKVQNDILLALDSKMKDLVEKAELDESEKPPKSPKSPKSPKTPKGKILKNREVTNVESSMPAPRDIVKKHDKEPQRERRRLMGIDIKVEKIIMSAEIAEGSTVEVKVYLDDEQGATSKPVKVAGKVLTLPEDDTYSFTKGVFGRDDLEDFTNITFEVQETSGGTMAVAGKVVVPIADARSTVHPWAFENKAGKCFTSINKIIESFESAEARKSGRNLDISSTGLSRAVVEEEEEEEEEEA
ncbi:hypothetical protein TrST_g894 [Triparma strigata]|uniref:Uncharacterized protein n=1 Tax=Triparma strigata TaxID=1606541 RepID=A0A9W7AUY9_9STRA|nr:hypothetical protein TrST_g894 [Triparma strigata]